MPIVKTTDPAAIDADLRRMLAGQTLELEDYRYTQPLTISGRRGDPLAPIIVHGSGAILGPGTSFEDYRKTGNILSKRQEASGKFPGLYYLADNAALIVRDCQWIIIEDLFFDGCWPTAIYLENCQNVVIRGVDFRGGTFAICAFGQNTRHILVEDCAWIQDVSDRGEAELTSIRENQVAIATSPPPDMRLWKELLWTQVHGAADEGFPVDIDNDARAFDGDFFRAWTIAGYVILRRNVVIDAFNGIHFFNEASRDQVDRHCRNVLIEDNWFVRIRDNAVEPENFAWNWTIRHNHFVDCYMPFSFEMQRSGHFYVLGNLGWNGSRPGPTGDDHASGQIFKFPGDHEAAGPHYVFNNTWSTMMAIAKKKRFASLYHFNNVLSLRTSDGTPLSAPPSLFGNGWETQDHSSASAREVVESEKARFTKRWAELSIAFDGDLIDHPNFPETYRDASYPIGGLSHGGPIAFLGNIFGSPESLKLVQPPKSMPYEISLADGSVLRSDAAGSNVGAWQGADRISLETCAFSDLWPGISFANFSGRVSA